MAEIQPTYFDPLSTSDLTAIICRKFEDQPPHPLVDLPAFTGPGLYAIYYVGTAELLYAPLCGRLILLYVGSARKHDSATGASAPMSSPLYSRVRQHARSIDESPLEISDFRVRLLNMPDVHIALGENGLRVGYKPVWNAILRSFGNHDPGVGRSDGEQSPWDAIYFGRSRTYGQKREDHAILLARAADLIDRQTGLLGTREGLDWSTYQPDAITASSLPKSGALKAEWVTHMVDTHSLERAEAERMTVPELKELAKQKLLDRFQQLMAESSNL